MMNFKNTFTDNANQNRGYSLRKVKRDGKSMYHVVFLTENDRVKSLNTRVLATKKNELCALEKAKEVINLNNKNTQGYSTFADFIKKEVVPQLDALNTKKVYINLIRDIKGDNYKRNSKGGEGNMDFLVKNAAPQKIEDILKSFKGSHYSQNTIKLKKSILYASYSKLIESLKRKGVLSELLPRPLYSFKTPKEAKKRKVKQYLDTNEFNQLLTTDCHELGQKAFKFSCLTGLRYSDLKNVNLDMIKEIDGQKYLCFHQKKTAQLVQILLTKEAVKLLKIKKPFAKLKEGFYRRATFTNWVSLFSKKTELTIHTARHTFANFMNANGVDHVTISKMLGHSSVKTTQDVYLYSDAFNVFKSFKKAGLV